MSNFESPLLIKQKTPFTEICFGDVGLSPELTGLRQQLNLILASTASELPPPLRREVLSIIDGYSGGGGNFFSLFYVPVWSFLHWAPASARLSAERDVLSAARTAHALSLFLHLWDDHLCDGQLRLDLLRLQFRTLAWQRFTSFAYHVCELSGAPSRFVDEHVAAYLTSNHSASTVTDLDEYCSRFSSQFAICTLTPRVLGYGLFGPEGADELYRVVDLFAISWRLLDDIQDVHLDVITDSRTAVWLELSEAERLLWANCRTSSLQSGKLHAETWDELCRTVRKSGVLARLLSRIDGTLDEAGQIAGSNGWAGLRREFEQCRQGIRAPVSFPDQS